MPLYRGNCWDGGCYLSKGCVVRRDPEDPDHFGKRNVGMYRMEEARLPCESKPSDYVFPGPRGSYIQNVQKAIQRIRRAAGIDLRRHDLRRTAATQMTSAGIPRPTVKRILNQVEKDVTDIYDRRSCDTEKRQALEAWARRLHALVAKLRKVKTEA